MIRGEQGSHQSDAAILDSQATMEATCYLEKIIVGLNSPRWKGDRNVCREIILERGDLKRSESGTEKRRREKNRSHNDREEVEPHLLYKRQTAGSSTKEPAREKGEFQRI